MDLDERHFQDVLIELRKEKKISQRQFADEIKFSQGTIYKWENNLSTPKPEILEYIADYFDVSIDYLVGRTMTRNNPMDKMNIMDKYKVIFEEDNSLTEEEKKFLLDYLETKHENK